MHSRLSLVKARFYEALSPVSDGSVTVDSLCVCCIYCYLKRSIKGKRGAWSASPAAAPGRRGRWRCRAAASVR